MIRRGFWLTTGAVTGIVAYRRVSAVGRRVSASLNPGATLKTGASLKTGTRRTAFRTVRETYRFTRDVREGMGLYLARHSESEGPTLRTSHRLTEHDDEKDGH